MATAVGVSLIFDSYEDDFLEYQSTIEKELLELEGRSGVIDKKDLAKCQRMLSDADGAIKQMEGELHTIPNKPLELDLKIRGYRSDYDKFKSRYGAVKAAADRASLLGNVKPGSQSAAGRQRLLDTNDRLRDGQRKLFEANQVALETESVGSTVVVDLHSQRETIQRSRANMGAVGDNLSVARTSIENMTRRVVQNKMVSLPYICTHELFTCVCMRFRS
eukprot:Platyproteum_vivax@DN6726_c0_g1_i4.p1